MLNEKEQLYEKASKAYALGEPIMTDHEFDLLELELIELGSELVNKVSEDFLTTDEEIVETDYETYSIRSVKTIEEARDFFVKHQGASFTATLKYDGVCAKVGITPSTMSAQSRNRGSRNFLDYTKALQTILTHPNTGTYFNITGEAYVPSEHLSTLRNVYDANKYVMPRSAAISLLRNPEKHQEHLHFLKFRAFATNNTLTTHEEELEWLRSLGFEVPKYHVFQIDWDMDFEEQITNIMNLVDTGEPSDGVVIQVNERDYDANISGKYMDTQVALKFGKWGGDVFEGTVIGIKNTPSKGNKGCVLYIEPLVLPDGATQTKINAYNLGIVERLKISKGSRIKFRRVSNNMCNLIY